MDRISGFLIRHYRLQQHISQEGLCKGICVVSYLSKLEQGLVNASEDIIHALFDVLNISYQDDKAYVALYRERMTTYFEKAFLHEDTTDLQKQILEQINILQCSPLIIDLLLFQIKINGIDKEDEALYLKLLEDASIFESYMSDDQLFLFCLLHVDIRNTQKKLEYLHQAGRVKMCSIQKYYLGHAYYMLGRNAEANEYLREGYALACEEGNAIMMLDISLVLGNSYSNTQDNILMLKYYEQCSMLARTLQRDDMLSVVEYNIGSSYLQWGKLSQALPYLLSSIQHKAVHEVFLNYQKLALLYAELNERDMMNLYLSKADQEAQHCKDVVLLNMHEFVHLYCDEQKRFNQSYVELLETLTLDRQETSTMIYGFRQFHARYLIEAYKKARRYKEALQLQERL